MKRKLLAFIGALAMMAGVFAATSPSAWAILDSGWQFQTCYNVDGGDYNMVSGERVVWYASDNHRYIQNNVYEYLHSDPNTRLSLQPSTHPYLDVFSKAVGGDWAKAFPTTYNPQEQNNYSDNFTPALNPAQGHSFLGRGHSSFDPVNCDVIITNN